MVRKIAFQPNRTGELHKPEVAPPGVNEGRNAMKARQFLVGVTCASLVGAAVLVSQAQAQESIYVPLLTYRTGPYSGSGIPIANGMHDYLAMLNERDGGIGGVKLNVEECETGYDTKKGVECWESV
jgi:branched-chain amino acid transport system substrate-binding protein